MKKGSLPLPQVHRVLESYYYEDSFVLISPDPNAGHRRRYSTIRVYRDGHAVCIGRELDLKLSRRVAERPSKLDGEPLEQP